MKTSKFANIILSLGLSVLGASLAYAAGYPCDKYIPQCPDPLNNGAQCGNNGTLVVGDEITTDWYHCNGQSTDCPVDSGKCNIMVKTAVVGHMLACDEGEASSASGFCATSKGTTSPLNIKCEGGKCHPTGPDHSLPPLTGAYPGLPGYEVPTLSGVTFPSINR